MDRRTAARGRTEVQRESSIVSAIMGWLKTVDGCHAVKVHGGPYGASGQPDITGCRYGRRFDLEVKRPGQKPTKLQEAEMDRWESAGSVVAVVHSLGEAQLVIRAIQVGEA